jgi:hypothetical protein
MQGGEAADQVHPAAAAAAAVVELVVVVVVIRDLVNHSLMILYLTECIYIYINI